MSNNSPRVWHELNTQQQGLKFITKNMYEINVLKIFSYKFKIHRSCYIL
jgi:hypothetical protein